MNARDQAPVVVELGQASTLTRGGQLPFSVVAWPLRVCAEFHGRAPRFVHSRPVGTTDALQEDDLAELGAGPLWPTSPIAATLFRRRD